VIEFSLNNVVPLERAEILDPLNGFVSAVVWPSGRCLPPAVGAQAKLTVGDTTFTLLVDDFALGHEGGWIRVVAPAARVARFGAEVFSTAEGVSFQQVIESRTAVNAPPALAGKVPAVVADCTLAQLLNDICSRHAGWTWWCGADRLELGLLDEAVTKRDGTVVTNRGTGTDVRLVEIPPRAGASVELPCGANGVVLHASTTWRAGAVPTFAATIGAIPAGVRLAPRQSVCWPAKVIQLDPFMVELNDEEQPGRTFHTRARLKARRADGGEFAEDIPIQVNDVLEAAIPLGGVSTLRVKVSPDDEAAPATTYSVRARSAEQHVSEKLTVTAKEKTETITTGETRVKQRWDIKKG
jgi:hypothetical protein